MRRTSISPAKDMDRRDYELLRKLGLQGDQSQAGFRQIDLGNAPSGGGGRPITDHGLLDGLADDDHLQYALLAGRTNGQWLRGSSSLAANASSLVTNAPFMATQNKAAGSSWSGVAIAGDAAVGLLLVVVVSTDNFADDTGVTNHHTSMTDTKGNTWTKQSEYTAAFFSGTRGTTMSIWTTIVTAALTAGSDTVTFNFDASTTAKGAQGYSYAGVLSGVVKKVSAASIAVQNATSGTGTGVLAFSNLRQAQYLFVRVTSVEDNNSTFTVDGGYTALGNEALSVTNGGALSSNIGCFGEFSIATTTSTSTAPTINYTNVPNVGSLLVALVIAPPATGLLLLQSVGSPIAATLELRDEQVTSSPLLVDQSIADDDRVTLKVRASATQTSRLTQWASSADAELSYIRASDGAFVGPIVAAGTDTHPDNIFTILGSADPTKKVMFEVDGLTAATTRTLTVPDADGTLILSQGTSAGQVIGTHAHTGGSASSLVIEGKVMLGENLAGVNFTTNQVLFVSSSPATLNTGTVSLARLALGLGSVATINSTANVRMLEVSAIGTPSATSGTIGTLSGFFMNSAVSIPTGVTITNLIGGQFNVSAGSTDVAAISNVIGNQIVANGNLTSSSTGNAFTGLEIQVSPRVQAFTNAYAINIIKSNGSNSGIAGTAYGINIGSTVFSAATLWIGLNIPVVSGPSLQKGFVIGDMQNSIVGTLELGSSGGAIANRPMLYLAQNGTTKNQITFVLSGALLTTPLAGAFEAVTDDLYFTINTGAARKKIVLDDGTALTAGRIPFATTNGRLTDDADFTFATDTLTVTKIAATTLTGLLTFADAIDIAVNATTGTKIATAAAQKIGFWGTAPIAQPTNAIAAATFVANTSAIADDSATFDGYTLGQVVKALRNAGLLA